jgi:hypothetical protein
MCPLRSKSWGMERLALTHYAVCQDGEHNFTGPRRNRLGPICVIGSQPYNRKAKAVVL